MAKHTTLDTLPMPESVPPVSSRKPPVSSGHYSIVHGVQRASEHPPVIITEKKQEKKISSGNIPVVLSPELTKRGRTIMGLAAVTASEPPPAEEAPVTQAPTSAPDTLQSPMRFSKPPVTRKPTVMGLDVSEELARLQEQRTEAARRRKALNDFLDVIDTGPFILKPRDSEVDWYVKAAFGSIRLQCRSHVVLSVGKAAVALDLSLPNGFKQAALAAVQSRINDVVTTVEEILFHDGNDPSVLTDDDCKRITRIADMKASSLSETVTAFIDSSTVFKAYEASVKHVAAGILAGVYSDNELGNVGLMGFHALFSQGWIPVGIMNDGELLVITK